MQCTQCAFGNLDGARFCRNCGTALPTICPACGHRSPPDNRFCGQCGQPLRGFLEQGSAEGRFASPQTYTPQRLAQRMLTSRSSVEGERKHVTVLFADLRGSMELLADRDPEEARHLLDPVLERMIDAVHRYEGMVNQVMGDGIMALFGAPIAHEDHALRACYAALRMQGEVGQYADEVRHRVGPLQIRVGMNSGEVVVRSIGSDLHMDYTAVGQTTHLAARMEQIAIPGSILMTPDTARLVEGLVEARARGSVQIKGLQTPLEVFELVGPGVVRTRLHAAVARGLTRFVGRRPELEQLQEALEQARGGHGQVVAIVGESGVGKSRLFWEFLHANQPTGWLVLETAGVSYGRAVPYLPWGDLLKSYCDITAQDSPREMRGKLVARVLTLDAGLEPALPALSEIIGLDSREDRWRSLDGRERRRRTLEAVKDLLLRESEVQPVAVVFEDLHQIDAESQAVLDTLVEALAAARLLLLVNYRPEYQHRWERKAFYRQLRLEPLPQESAEELLQSLLGDDPALQPVKSLLVTRTEGTPFFLEEMVRTLVETKILVGERGGYRLARVVEEVEVPATIQATLAARIDRLPPEVKQVLQTASVIGGGPSGTPSGAGGSPRRSTQRCASPGHGSRSTRSPFTVISSSPTTRGPSTRARAGGGVRCWCSGYR